MTLRPIPREAVAEEIRAAGGVAEASHADVTDAAQVGDMVEMAAQRLGPVDVVINNAGIVLTAPFEELTGEMFSRSFDVHVRGAFNVARAAWSSMSERGYGRILNICSVDGVLFGNLRHTAYDAAKGGVAGLTRGMAVDGAAHGIHVNGLLPGAFTRGQDSVDHSLTPAAVIDMSPRAGGARRLLAGARRLPGDGCLLHLQLGSHGRGLRRRRGGLPGPARGVHTGDGAGPLGHHQRADAVFHAGERTRLQRVPEGVILAPGRGGSVRRRRNGGYRMKRGGRQRWHEARNIRAVG